MGKSTDIFWKLFYYANECFAFMFAYAPCGLWKAAEGVRFPGTRITDVCITL